MHGVNSSGFLSRLHLNEHRLLVFPSALTAMVVDVAIVALSLFSPISIELRLIISLVGIAGLVYILALYLLFLPNLKQHRWLNWAFVVANSVVIAFMPLLLPGAAFSALTVLAVAVVIVSTVSAGRKPAYFFIFVYTILTFFVMGSLVKLGTAEWVHLISIPVLFIVVTETTMALGNIIHAQMERLETVNRVAQDISSTIESPQVITLVCNAVQHAFKADTYYVGLLEGDQIWMELLYDDGKFYPRQRVPLGNGPGSWVIRNRRTLLIRDFPKQRVELGLDDSLIGAPKLSQSWMGAPMISGAEVLGLLAVASYSRNVYQPEDAEVLENIAKQAALAIDNATHHTEVEDQSHLDSLTRIYNHGYFLVYLNEYARFAIPQPAPFSLMMLDIDHFKQYNDSYGHQLGDAVLVRMVETIKANIRSTDILGRWGGEEFIMLLPDASGVQTFQIAERIRSSLHEVRLLDRSDKEIPAPTVSMGIAVCPDEVKDIEGLIHLADKRLYIAKARGRNQVEPEYGEPDLKGEIKLPAGSSPDPEQ